MTTAKKICTMTLKILNRQVIELRLFAKISAVTIFLSLIFCNVNAYATDFQELQKKIMLPDRIRHRQNSHKLTRPSPPNIKVPSKKVSEQSKIRYTQRQPKKPPRLKHPQLPVATSDHRGSNTPKRFGPPQFRR